MAKILSTDDLMEIVTVEKLPGMEAEMDAVIDAVDVLAMKIAQYYGINKGETTWEGKAFDGLCSSFYPKALDQICPDPINDGDPGGDWEAKHTLT